MLGLRASKPQEFEDVSQEEFELKVQEFSPKKVVSNRVESDSTTLYSVGSTGYKLWTVIAYWNTTSGDLTVSSGDCDREWNVIIPIEGISDLKSALIKSGGTNPEKESSSDDCVDLLRQVFGGRQENPFEEIRKYLDIHGIPSRNSHW